MEPVFNAIALILALAAIALVGGYTLITGSPPTPSSRRVRAALLNLLPTDQDGPILEMGSGFGGLARALAARFPDADVIGYEQSPLPWFLARAGLAIRPVPNLRFVRGDFRTAPLERARLVTCYLAGPAMTSLAPMLTGRLPMGATVLSATFAVPGWAPVAQGRADDLYRSPVYLYRVPDSLR